MGGLHAFTGWTGPMLTDSGGFQVFSLEGLRTIAEDGVEFTSHLDGSVRRLTPERATAIQWALGADVAMAFDHVVPGQAPYELADEGMERTLRWLSRCKAEHGTLVEQAIRSRPNTVADHPGRRLRRPPAPLARRDTRTGAVDRNRDRGAVGGRAEGGYAPDSRGAGTSHASRHPPLSYGRRFSARPARGHRPGGGSVRLRGGHPERTPRDGVAADRSGQCEGCRLQGLACAAGRRMRLRDLHHVPARLPAPPLYGGGHARAASGLIHNIRFLIRLGEQARQRICDGTFDPWHCAWLDRYHRGDT